MKISNSISGLRTMACSTERPALVLVLLLVCSPLWAGLLQPGSEEPLESPNPQPMDTQGPVDVGFLEFLGQWETDDGQWIAPEDLADENFAALIADMVQTEDEKSE